MRCGFWTAAVLMETLSAPALSKRLTSSTLRTPPPTVRGMNTCAATSSTTCRIRSRSSELDLILHVVEEVAAQVFIPLTEGGGVDRKSTRLNSSHSQTSYA